MMATDSATAQFAIQIGPINNDRVRAYARQGQQEIGPIQSRNRRRHFL